MVLPASTASTFAARGDHRFERPHADRRHVESHVLPRFGDFDDRESADRAQLAGPANAGIGPLDRFDGQDGPVFDDHALADVEPAHLLGDFPAQGDVFLLVRPSAGGSVKQPSPTSNSGA